LLDEEISFDEEFSPSSFLPVISLGFDSFEDFEV